MPTTLNIEQAAKMLGISRSSAYKAAREGTLPVQAFKIGGRYVVPTKPLLDLLGLDELPATEGKSA